MTIDVEMSNGGESSAEVPDLFTNMPQSATIDSSSLGYQTLALGIAVNSNYRKTRPTRESVLQRLSEALMRRSLTKVCLFVTFVFIYRLHWLQSVIHTSIAPLFILHPPSLSVDRLIYHNEGCSHPTHA